MVRCPACFRRGYLPRACAFSPEASGQTRGYPLPAHREERSREMALRLSSANMGITRDMKSHEENVSDVVNAMFSMRTSDADLMRVLDLCISRGERNGLLSSYDSGEGTMRRNPYSVTFAKARGTLCCQQRTYGLFLTFLRQSSANALIDSSRGAKAR